MSDLTWEGIKDCLAAWAEQSNEWAGLPLPHDHLELQIEPRYPFPDLDGMSFKSLSETTEDEVPAYIAQAFKGLDPDRKFDILNHWHDSRGRDVFVYRLEDEDTSKVAILEADAWDRRLRYLVNTMSCGCVIWDPEAEIQALDKLRQLIKPRAFRYYLITGMFLETSPRSKITYLFRRCFPTIAISTSQSDEGRPIASLCLHPIGYYEQSFAGVMVPTDDVIAHLLMMRGDERKFWAKANHHSFRTPESGL